METFTASSGNQIKRDDTGNLRVYSKNGSLHDWSLAADGAADLRELFQAERDEELGRWRLPGVPGIVAYRRPGTSRAVLVIDESRGYGQVYTEGDLSAYSGRHASVARAYFAAHPEPKPWHDAKIGEVWLLGFASQTLPAIVVEDDGAPWFMVADDINTPSRFKLSSDAFTDARRIFPEATK